ncbi:Transcriptional regulatory protein, C terminal [Streptomyces sp. yr375]|uniref:AfsR/SARP family transcriptional regulator n=1 Tax=Streptomyces sp. yr375 TaxID=1761906 RepID=UPI0008C25A4C|nr:BTAD domain-containing putative transcriptional regulator [Streptomyces sp. yr375]SES03405.1 Transcriptional regulatory protein, C terminal [Streptomyces sp. yr375]
MSGTAHPEYAVEIRTLGRFDVVVGGRPVTRWRAGRARHLLQYLLLHPDCVISRDILFEALWPDLSAPRSSLKVAVHTLRNILASEGAAATGRNPSGLRILTHEYGYSIEAKNVWVDFQEFDSLILGAQTGTLDAPGPIAQLQDAVELYQGDFLPGMTMPWVEPQREWLRSLALSALDRLVEAAERTCDDFQVLHFCRKVLKIEPLHEKTYRTLIALHGRLGQFSQADRWYKLCASHLREAVGVGPAEATRAMYSRAVSGELTRVADGPTLHPVSSVSATGHYAVGSAAQ